jgi:hypothetical protein
VTEPPPNSTELTNEQIREVLAWCRENPTHENALTGLVELREHVLRPELAAEVLDASEAVVRAILADPAPRPAVHAQMTILLSALLQIDRQRERVDALFVDWLRHPASYGPNRATPPAFQRPEFVQRLADLLGWQSLDLQKDRDGLVRFLTWVDTWTMKNKYRARRTLDQMRRIFPAPDLWKLVRFG